MNAVLLHKKTALISQNGFINPDAIRHFIVGQTKKYNQCRKLLAGYVNDANNFFSKVNKFKKKDEKIFNKSKSCVGGYEPQKRRAVVNRIETSRTIERINMFRAVAATISKDYARNLTKG